MTGHLARLTERYSFTRLPPTCRAKRSRWSADSTFPGARPRPRRPRSQSLCNDHSGTCSPKFHDDRGNLGLRCANLRDRPVVSWMIVLLRCLSGTSSRRTRSTQYGPADGARVECLGFAMPAWKLFDPSAGTPVSAPYGASVGGESAYVYSDAIVVAVNSALLTGRPLLVRGPPGSGKSALAQDFTSRTNPLELLYRSKATERVRDSQVPELRSESHYYEPGVLWRAFEAAGSGAVALLDDIDRASPDLDDPLLTTLRSSSFSIEELELVVRAPSHAKLLLVITSNEDRALATRFTRSCVLLDLPPPSIEQLMEIGRISGLTEDDALARQVADYMFQATAHESIPTNVSTFLDALKVAVALGVKPGGPDWDAVLFHVREAWGLSLTDHRADDRASPEQQVNRSRRTKKEAIPQRHAKR
jgi:MoxR-like ATPase